MRVCGKTSSTCGVRGLEPVTGFTSVYGFARSGASNVKVSPITAAIRVNKQLISSSRF